MFPYLHSTQENEMSRKFWLFKSFLVALLALTTTTFASFWETPLEVSTGVSGPDTPPIIVADSNDNSAMIWSQAGEVYTSYRPYDSGLGTWEAPTNHGKGDRYQINMDEAGNVTIAFRVGTTNSQIVAAFRPFGASWTTLGESIATATDASGFITALSLTCTSTNFYGYVSWYDSHEVKMKSLFRRGAGSGTGATGWDTTTGPVDINPGTHTATTQSAGIIKVHSNGNATIVAKYTSPAEDCYSSSTTSPGGGYTSPITMNFISIANVEIFDFDMTTNGNAIVATNLASQPRVRTTSDVYTWSSPLQSITPSANTTDYPSVGVDSNGLATIVYATTANEIQIAHDVVDGTTWAPTTITTAATTVNRPLVHVSSNGYRIVAWTEGTADPYSLIALRGQNTTLEATSTIIDAEVANDSTNIYTSTTSRGFATWNDIVTNGFAEASRTYEPPTPGPLLYILGKKRLIYQQTRYP